MGMTLEPCPYLPEVDRIWRAVDMVKYRECRDAEFYLAALSYAQSLWLENKPAQALLQGNKSFLADLRGNEAVLKKWPPPYLAKRWLIERSQDDEGFLGNPVRHYQHLASRMSGPRREVRIWRAWACFHLAEKLRPDLPRDQRQIERERLVIPSPEEVATQLGTLGWEGELASWQEAYA